MEFNATKTWIEYINRLIGVLVGFITLITALFSLRLYRMLPRVTSLTVFALLLVIVQGGIGAYVVRTNLQTGTITLHMVVALTILLVLLSAYVQSWNVGRFAPNFQVKSNVWLVGGVVLLLTLTQVIFGTQVRESVDLIAKELGEENRSRWLSQLAGNYDLHKYFYYLVLASHIVWGAVLSPLLKTQSFMAGLYLALMSFLGAEILLGIGMHNWGIPAWMQPLHLLFATLIVGLCFALLQVVYTYQRSQQALPQMNQIL